MKKDNRVMYKEGDVRYFKVTFKSPDRKMKMVQGYKTETGSFPDSELLQENIASMGLGNFKPSCIEELDEVEFANLNI